MMMLKNNVIELIWQILALKKFLNKIIEQATHKRRQLNGVKTHNILLHKKEAMTEQDLIVQNKQVDDRRVPNE